jgi:O-antigen ligase
VRPPGLGKDAGFAGGVGLLALPCTLALLATGGRRKRRVAVLLCLGSLLAVVTGLGRLQVVGAVFAMIAFALLSASAGRRMRRPLTALFAILVLAVPLGAILVSVEAPGTFDRYAEIAPGNAVSAKDKKTSELTRLPHLLSVAPFGVGLASAGAAAGFGGRVTGQIEGHGVGSETQYNFIADEVGLPGLLLWAGLLLNLILLAARRLRHIADVELRIDLAGVFAVLVSLLLIGISGPVMGSAALGSFFWFTAGVGSYWFLGPGRAAAAKRSAATA